MWKIIYQKLEDNKVKKRKGAEIFCKIDNFPIKYALFTNNHFWMKRYKKLKKNKYRCYKEKK